MTAEAQGVTSYPTIKYFPKGSTVPQAYEGGRTEKDFVEFLNEHAGTHRAVGGGLDAKAGTIEALDSLVYQLSAGGNLAIVSEEVSKAAKGMKEKYAAYYVKVMDKLAKSQDYAATEMARLSGLIKKGGLAPEKLDDLTSRKNILQRFASKSQGKDEL